MLRVVIADDEPLALDLLAALFDEVPGAEIVARAGSGEEAVEAVAAHRPDLVMLDVEMPGCGGLQAAFDLGGANRPEIVFVTAHDRFAVDAFDLNAADYLLKPVRLHRLRQAVDRVRRRRQAPAAPSAPEPFLWAPTREGRARVPESAIRWIEQQKDHALLHTAARSYMIRTTMGELERSLRDPELVRVHRSAIVRLGAVAAVRRSRKAVLLALDDGRLAPVGPSYAAETLRRLAVRTRP